MKCIGLICFVLVTGLSSYAGTYYVDVNNANPSSPYTNWATAATVIQDAVDAASAGDTILVSNGTYRTGGTRIPDYEITNRVMISKAVDIRSVNGPEVTTIEGKYLSPNRSIRCVYLGVNAQMSGFTLTKGYSIPTGHPTYDKSAGGVLMRTGSVLSNCIVTRCESAYSGGGVVCYQGGLLTDCVIKDNEAESSEGGGISMQSGGRAVRCTIVDNLAKYGGGVNCYEGGSLSNCVIARNEALVKMGGIYAYYGGPVVNCTICYNTASTNGGGTDAVGLDTYRCGNVRNNLLYRNTWQGNEFDLSLASTSADYNRAVPSAGSHCITNVPAFVSDADRNYNLMPGSPGIDAGNNSYAALPTDLAGNSRINGTVDLGAYEYYVTSVDITNANATVFYEVMSYAIGGTNGAAIAGTMTWTNALNGSNGSFAAVSPWRVENIPLAVGDNAITVWGQSTSGISVSDTVTVTRVWEHGGVSPCHYVWTNSPAPAWPYTNWNTAAHVIQDAVDVASSNDVVLATNGVYDAGGVAASGEALTNRVCISRPITLRSVGGPSVTAIVGYGPRGNDAVRCVRLVDGAEVDGFTLTNGHSVAAGSAVDTYGAGIYLAGGGTVTNCIVTGCEAYHAGGVCLNGGGLVVDSMIEGNAAQNAGGMSFEGGGLARWCRIVGNQASQYDGGGVVISSGGELDHCEVIGNSAPNGGGGGIWTIGGSLTNCLVADNSCGGSGGGIYGQNMDAVVNCTIAGNGAGSQAGGFRISQCDSVYNNIIYANSAPSHANAYESSSTVDYTCTIPAVGSNCITNDPLFIDSAYRVASNSLCVNAGHDAYALMAVDLDGFQRIAVQVDLGAYEYIPWPLVGITNESASVVREVDTYDIGGWKSDSVVGFMGWTNALTGSNDTFASVNPWSIADISLAMGTNVIFVWGTNASGAVTSDTVTITRSWEHGGDSPFHYAAPGGGDVWPYTNWMMAAVVLQDAVDAAVGGDVVLVSNGIYATGGTVTPDTDLSTRLVMDKPVRACSVNGQDVTFIVGRTNGADNGSSAARCAYVGDGSTLSGFGLYGGCTREAGSDEEKTGGGAFVAGGGVVSNCTVFNCTAWHGGGVSLDYSGGTLVDSVITGNHAAVWAGGILMLGGSTRTECCIVSSNDCNDKGGGVHMYHGGELVNCLVADNEAGNYGGGVYLNDGGTVKHSTLVNNSSDRGGGIYFYDDAGSVINSIITSNTCVTSGTNIHNSSGCSIIYSCAPDGVVQGVDNCTTDNPLFADAWNQDYALQGTSPCIDAGTNVGVVVDLGHIPRPLDGNHDGTNVADMGVYEFINAQSDSDGDTMTDLWEDDHGLQLLVVDASEDPDGDGYNNGSEFIADTDPQDGNDYICIESISSNVVSFQSSDERQYTLLSCTGLVEEVWTSVETRMGSGGEDSMSSTNTGAIEFFKLEVQIP